jgi:hypothetical protein
MPNAINSEALTRMKSNVSSPLKTVLISECIRIEVEGRLGVQVVEGVGLVASGFQFFTCLAAVFAEEVGGLTATGARYGTTDTNLGLG